MEGLYIAAAIPIFFLAIGIEVLVTRARGESRYDFADSISNLSCGIGSLVVGVFTNIVVLAIFFWLYALTPLRIPTDSLLGWVALLFAVDLGYYAFHRSTHRSALLWATGHVVHHQSEEYNLSVALRQQGINSAVAWIFYTPLLLLGFHPAAVLGMRTINTLYQFWIHTEAVRKIGPFEHVLNTPSHHRVHHGINPEYIDKNYAGIFIIWDKLFGTFEPERAEVVYGTVTPLRSFNPLWANVEGLVKIWRRMDEVPRWYDKLLLWVMPPGWLPKSLGGTTPVPPISRAERPKYRVPKVPGLVPYVLINFVVMVAATTAMLIWMNILSVPEQVGMATLMLMTLTSWGGLLEQKKWGIPFELLRLVLVAAGCVYLYNVWPDLAMRARG